MNNNRKTKALEISNSFRSRDSSPDLENFFCCHTPSVISENSNGDEPTMSYVGHIMNEAMFGDLWNSKFYTLRMIHETCESLCTVDYSVVSSRRDGHTTVRQFLAHGIRGEEIFDENVRFRCNNRGDIFVSDVDLNFSNTVISLVNTLSHRETNVAKDTAAANKGGLKSDESEKVTIMKDQGTQDNAKRFEELVKVLKSYSRNSSACWTRRIFEERVATWQ